MKQVLKKKNPKNKKIPPSSFIVLEKTTGAAVKDKKIK